MKIREYLDRKEQYPMLSKSDCIGRVVDIEKGLELVIGVQITRDVYSKMGYLCNEDAPELLHVCVCAMFEQIFEMPIIKTILLKPEMICQSFCEENEVSEEVKRYSVMALYALREAFKGHLKERNKK